MNTFKVVKGIPISLDLLTLFPIQLDEKFIGIVPEGRNRVVSPGEYECICDGWTLKSDGSLYIIAQWGLEFKYPEEVRKIYE